MGIDPTEETYTEADDDGRCHFDLFDGRTPKYIEAHVSGIIKCPVATSGPPNGTFILTEHAPNKYSYEASQAYYFLEFDAGHTDFWITSLPGLADFFLGAGDECDDEIANGLSDCTPPNWGHSGNVKLFWGPGISP